MTKVLSILRIFRVYQRAIMGWILYVLASLGLSYVTFSVGYKDCNNCYASGSVPAITYGLLILAIMLLLASTVVIPAWILRFTKGSSDWAAFAIWMVLAAFFVPWIVILIVIPGIINMTGGDFWYVP